MTISSSFLILAATIFLLGIIAPSCLGSDGYTLYSGKTLKAYDYLENDPYVLVMQKDCNLVIFHRDDQEFKPIWSTNTNEYGQDCFARLENNGDFILYNQENSRVFDIVPIEGEIGDYVLILHADNGEILIYGPHRVGTTPPAQNSTAGAKRAAVIKLATSRKLPN